MYPLGCSIFPVIVANEGFFVGIPGLKSVKFLVVITKLRKMPLLLGRGTTAFSQHVLIHTGLGALDKGFTTNVPLKGWF